MLVADFSRDDFRDKSVLRSRWDVRSILRSWTNRTGEVPRVRWTERCGIRSLTPMAVAASSTVMFPRDARGEHRSKAETTGWLCARALRMVYAGLRRAFVDHQVVRREISHHGAALPDDRQGQVDVYDARAGRGDAVRSDEHFALSQVDCGVLRAKRRVQLPRCAAPVRIWGLIPTLVRFQDGGSWTCSPIALATSSRSRIAASPKSNTPSHTRTATPMAEPPSMLSFLSLPSLAAGNVASQCAGDPVSQGEKPRLRICPQAAQTIFSSPPAVRQMDLLRGKIP
jgi:hypothetical protein